MFPLSNNFALSALMEAAAVIIAMLAGALFFG